MIAAPTHDGLRVVVVIAPVGEFQAFRSDVRGSYFASLGATPELAERVRQGRLEGKFFGTADLPNFFRKPYGAGWALVGDADYHKDPITAQGITDAFCDAERLTEAVDAGLSGRRSLDQALAAYQEERDAEHGPMYELTCQLAALQPPPPEMQQLFGALRANPAETDRFFGTMAGTVSIPEFYAPDHVRRIVGGAAVRPPRAAAAT